MLAEAVFNQNNGDVTKAYYAGLSKKGYAGLLAVALFRAQKRSTAAKRYAAKRGTRKFTRDAYEVKNWSLEQVCTVLSSHDFGFTWGWQRDPQTKGFEWVLYVDLPTGQCSFHSADRLSGPDYFGRWIPGDGSTNAIIRYCDVAWGHLPAPTPEQRSEAVQEAFNLNPAVFTF